MTARGNTMGTLVPIVMHHRPFGPARQPVRRQRGGPGPSGGCSGVRVAAGVPGLSHRDVLANFGVVHQAHPVCRPPSWNLITGTRAAFASFLNRLETWSGFHGRPSSWQKTKSASCQAGPAFMRARSWAFLRSRTSAAVSASRKISRWPASVCGSRTQPDSSRPVAARPARLPPPRTVPRPVGPIQEQRTRLFSDFRMRPD
jgi:hypothetical protein